MCEFSAQMLPSTKRRTDKHIKHEMWFYICLSVRRFVEGNICRKFAQSDERTNIYKTRNVVLYLIVRSSLCRKQHLPKIRTLFCPVHIKKHSCVFWFDSLNAGSHLCFRFFEGIMIMFTIMPRWNHCCACAHVPVSVCLCLQLMRLVLPSVVRYVSLT